MATTHKSSEGSEFEFHFVRETPSPSPPPPPKPPSTIPSVEDEPTDDEEKQEGEDVCYMFFIVFLQWCLCPVFTGYLILGVAVLV